MMKRAMVGLLGFAVFALLEAARAPSTFAEEIFYDGFKYAPGAMLATKGKHAPNYDVTVYEQDSEKQGRLAFALVARKGLRVRGKKSFGRAAFIGTTTDKHSAAGRISARKKLEFSQEKSEVLYFSIFINVPKESNLPDPGARIGARLRLTFGTDGQAKGAPLELGVENHEQSGKIFAGFGSTRVHLAKAKAGKTYLLVLRFTDPKGDWNPEVSAVLDPGKDEPKQWTLVKKGGAKGDYKLTGVELFAERAGWARGPTKAAGLIDEVRVGTKYEDVVLAR